MTGPYLLSIDQGTSSSRAILFSSEGRVVGVRQKPLKLYYPQNGWVEQNPDDILNDTLWTLRALAEDYPEEMRAVAGCGITNQRETTILWNRKTGKPVYNAIVWQDRRTAAFCDDLKTRGLEQEISQKTGLLIDPYFSATKIHWILSNIEGVSELARKGDVLFGTVECFLLWNLTGGLVHAMDATNASRTMMFNAKTQEWDSGLLDIFGLSKITLPEVRDNISNFGQIEIDGVGQKITVGGMAGDQQAALIGQGCVHPGMVKSTYGTGCFALMNIGSDFSESKNRLLTTVGYRIAGKVTYALEGSIFNAGTAVQFLRDNFEFFSDSAESDILATSVEGADGVYFVPAFTGLGAPYWDPQARGVITGLQRSTTKAHVTRAALEAQGYQTRDLIDAMKKDSGMEIETIRADGGLVASDFMCRFLADMLGVRVEVPAVAESTAWGAAVLAGVQSGVFSSLEDAGKKWRAARHYEPKMAKDRADSLYKGWTGAVRKTL